MGGECLLRLNPLLAGREGTSAAFPKLESYARHSGARPTKEAESPESSNHRRMFTGFRARLRFASAPRNDKFHGIAGLGQISGKERAKASSISSPPGRAMMDSP